MSFWKPGTKQAQGNKKPEVDEVKSVQNDNNARKNGRDVAEKDVKTTLSKGVMTMKFMKRKADADLESINIAEKRRKQLDSAWISDGEVNSISITAKYSRPSMTLC
jgi:M-phase phosphoprotein 6